MVKISARIAGWVEKTNREEPNFIPVMYLCVVGTIAYLVCFGAAVYLRKDGAIGAYDALALVTVIGALFAFGAMVVAALLAVIATIAMRFVRKVLQGKLTS